MSNQNSETSKYTLMHGGFSDGIYDRSTGERVFSANMIGELGYRWGRLIGAGDAYVSSIIPELTKRYNRWLKS